ncbi:MAG TPA: bifunctional phosphopantothenoylcysteine decarboxylase/phosphopantothenate--cysteine ligase CoaBC [Candidatus Cottocaccamicrobium excrementipullorum]|nr:bifunctional phosphopantothenoylcysteine decarboxylase/phosphopantothenate--cysteine ligase CoaBC [Candidatus Cottocaccamicrobium excrementipullorum]
MLKGKTVILGVSGGIAAYKIPNLASMLVKSGAQVHVIMTENAANFITAVTFETLTGNKCIIDTFDRNFTFEVEHVSLAKKADLLLVAPATANVIGKLAHGICDDMLTTTAMACQCPKIVAPAMNTRMYENPVLQDNLKLLEHYGMKIIQPAKGHLACGDTGAGKMPEPEELFDYICQAIEYPKDLEGKKILVTAGPTRESIDPVRFITNHSSGKMGYALAKAAARRGAEVTLVSGPVSLPAPRFLETVYVETAKEMFQAVSELALKQDAIIKAAAVADYRPAAVADHKIKKSGGELSLELEPTDDILAWLGQHRREDQFLCGFSMETENLIENSRKKLEKKNIDMIAANSLKEPGAGFGVDTNVITLITRKGLERLEKMTKEEAAHEILNRIFC